MGTSCCEGQAERRAQEAAAVAAAVAEAADDDAAASACRAEEARVFGAEGARRLPSGREREIAAAGGTVTPGTQIGPGAYLRVGPWRAGRAA